MKKAEIQVGGSYAAKISSAVVEVKITSVCSFGGWNAINTKTGREVRIKSAAKLRYEIGNPKPMPCGYVRKGVSLQDRLVHYRACSDATCQKHASNWEKLKADAAGGIQITKVPVSDAGSEGL